MYREINSNYFTDIFLRERTTNVKHFPLGHERQLFNLRKGKKKPANFTYVLFREEAEYAPLSFETHNRSH